MYLHKAVAPDGSEYRRYTKRTYTHCLFAHHGGVWVKVAWIGRAGLVKSRISASKRWYPDCEFFVAEATRKNA